MISDHTWNIVIDYHLCPACQFINESRKEYQYKAGVYEKTVECERCHTHFTVQKKRQLKFGPLIGHPQPVSMDWNAT